MTKNRLCLKRGCRRNVSCQIVKVLYNEPALLANKWMIYLVKYDPPPPYRNSRAHLFMLYRDNELPSAHDAVIIFMNTLVIDKR